MKPNSSLGGVISQEPVFVCALLPLVNTVIRSQSQRKLKIKQLDISKKPILLVSIQKFY